MYPLVFAQLRRCRTAFVLALLAVLLHAGMALQGARHEILRAWYGPLYVTLQLCSAEPSAPGLGPGAPADNSVQGNGWCAVCAATLAVPLGSAPVPMGPPALFLLGLLALALEAVPAAGSDLVLPPVRAPPSFS